MISLARKLRTVGPAVPVLLLTACASAPLTLSNGGPAASSTSAAAGSSSGGAPVLAPLTDEGRLTAPTTYEQSGISLAPPLSGDAPSVTPQAAYNDCLSGDAICSPGISPTIVLARVTDMHSGTQGPDGSLIPLMNNRLVFVLRFDGEMCVPAGVLPGSPAPQPQPCSAVNFIDAATGAVIYSVQGAKL